MANVEISPMPRRMEPAMDILETPERVIIGARLLSDLVPDYLVDCQRTGAKRKTITNYAYQLEPFRRWWNATGPAISWQLTEDVLRQYPPWLRQQPRNDAGDTLQPSTIHTCVRRVRQYLKWLHKSGRISIDIVSWAPMPALPQPSVHTLAIDEIHALMLAGHGVHRIRDACLVAFLLETATRRVEAASATWENVHYADGHRGYVWLEVVKGYLDYDRRRYVVFGTVTGKLLQVWQFISGHDSGPIFGITDNGIRHVMRALSQRTGIDFAPHDFRRTFATYWMRHCRPANRDLAERLLEVQLGHQPRTVTQQHYLALTHIDVLDVYVSPFDEIEIAGLTGGSGVR